MAHSSGTVLISGASTGIGETTARHLAQLGFDVLAGVRRPEDGERLAALSPRIAAVTLDVTDAASIAAVADSVDRLDGLVNNAGIAVAGPVELVPIEDWRRQLEVNVVGQVAVTQALLPAVRRARGRIVFTGSVAGRFALPGVGAYAASKHALEAIADSLRREVAAQGVRVSLLEPGSIKTPIWAKGVEDGPRQLAIYSASGRELYAPLLDWLPREGARQDRIAIPPERVARAVEHALTARRPRARYIVGADSHAMIRVLNQLPGPLVDRVIARAVG